MGLIIYYGRFLPVLKKAVMSFLKTGRNNNPRSRGKGDVMGLITGIVSAINSKNRASQTGREGGAEMGMAVTGILSKGRINIGAPERVIKSLLENRIHIFTHKNRKYVCPQHKKVFWDRTY
jgi:hypothetical protein